jgi:hypothetical protein
MSQPLFKPAFDLTEFAKSIVQTTDTMSRLMSVGRDAAKAVGFSDVKLKVEEKSDSTGNPAYFFKFRLQPSDSFDGKIRMRLSKELRDRLLRQGDERYPFIEVDQR